jgi:hypothetical protein
VERVLEEACRLDGGSAHARALLNLVREDYFTQRGARLHGSPPTPSVSPAHAREITSHVPAPECRTWQVIHRRTAEGS